MNGIYVLLNNRVEACFYSRAPRALAVTAVAWRIPLLVIQDEFHTRMKGSLFIFYLIAV